MLRPSVKTVALLCMLSPRHLNLQLRGCFCAVRVYTLIQHTDEGHSRPPLAQKAKLCFKLLLLQRLDENLKQKHFRILTRNPLIEGVPTCKIYLF